VLDLSDMEPRIDWYRAAARRPTGKHYLKELGAILHAQDEPVTRLETARHEATCEAGNAADEFGVAPTMYIVGDRRRLGLAAGDIK
jgi:hypothetical protein